MCWTTPSHVTGFHGVIGVPVLTECGILGNRVRNVWGLMAERANTLARRKSDKAVRNLLR